MLLGIYWSGTIDNIMNIHWALVGDMMALYGIHLGTPNFKKITSPSTPFASKERKLGLLGASCLNSFIGSQGFLFLIVRVTIFGII